MATKSSEIKPQYILIVAAVAVLAFVIAFATVGQTAKFSASAQWQKFSEGTTVVYKNGILAFNVVNDAGKDISTSNVGIRLVGADRKPVCYTGLTIGKQIIDDAPKCVSGCGSTLMAGGAVLIEINLAGSKCDLARVQAGQVLTAQLYFGDSQARAEGKVLV